MMGGHGFTGGMGGMGLLGGLLGLFLFALLAVTVVLVIVWLWRKLSASTATAGHQGTSTARELLEQRYARGEIDREEFLRVREDLT